MFSLSFYCKICGGVFYPLLLFGFFPVYYYGIVCQNCTCGNDFLSGQNCTKRRSMAKKNPFFSKFGTRLESFDPGSIQSYIHLLSREHGMLENLFNAIREGIVVISENGRILYHNAVAKEIFGIPDDFSRVSINSFVKGVDWENIFASADSSDHTVRTEVEIFYPVRRVLSFYRRPKIKGD